ncbi:biotin--[acetyl-CoA-carboxylase] ligase [Methylobacterium gossipiicola]|uniref:biotin--[biotin carboxyl-carrier protein] ligase n=1 Tax=Methylobacterium gossipiicola TaxID=582675 RepID=A0A1I2RKA7_9HYPH|nr:biotin--[acetyl-CoA-carboxylase] ligase [Methylobacterium gossipiicola]SFG38196.1 BirA family transcriptional regulator, biotin operon repressor / biotin-[acetyl-CoA-carboxylase] ligase [Methylobacterium gossipiicola]
MSGYRLGERARAAGHRLHVHESLGSTNTEALERARAGETGPLWVAAHRQLAGRGRRGNAWASEPGNLTASLLWPVDDVEPADVPTLGFVAGVGLMAALDRVVRVPPPRHMEGGSPLPGGGGQGAVGELFDGGIPRSIEEREPGGLDDAKGGVGQASFRLKWPNDVLVSGAKLAGLLLEAETLPGGRRAVVMGFGVNVAAAPEGLPYPATCLRQLGHATRAEDLFVCLTNGIVEAARDWDRGRGFSRIRERWIADAAGIGAPVTVRTGDTHVHGIFETIDEAGRLVIRSDEGTRRTVTAGEVHLGTAATAA